MLAECVSGSESVRCGEERYHVEAVEEPTFKRAPLRTQLLACQCLYIIFISESTTAKHWHNHNDDEVIEACHPRNIHGAVFDGE